MYHYKESYCFSRSMCQWPSTPIVNFIIIFSLFWGTQGDQRQFWEAICGSRTWTIHCHSCNHMWGNFFNIYNISDSSFLFFFWSKLPYSFLYLHYPTSLTVFCSITMIFASSYHFYLILPLLPCSTTTNISYTSSTYYLVLFLIYLNASPYFLAYIVFSDLKLKWPAFIMNSCPFVFFYISD